jgi:2'-5' RNA ligase
MHRLFVAIRPPEWVRSQLLDLMEGLNGARWQDEDQLHLTLRFIGEVDGHTADDICTSLGTIRHPAFALALSGLGTFNRRGQPVTLWAGVTPHEPLQALHKKIDQAILRAGVEPDHRAYIPHITLARLSRSIGSMAALMERAGGLSSPPFPIDNFRLYESDLTPQGAVYSVVARYKLD